MSNYSFQADINLFNPDTTQYNGENALFLADCAKLAYHKRKRAEKREKGTDLFNKINPSPFYFFTKKYKAK